MLIVMKQDATSQQVENVCQRIRQLGFEPHKIPGSQRLAIGITGNKGPIDPQHFVLLEGIAECVPVSHRYKLVSREVKPQPSSITIPCNTPAHTSPLTIGPSTFTIIAGPCSVESTEQVTSTAQAVHSAGAHILRGGAFKPRTNPYDFQGLLEDGLKILARARKLTAMPIITEAKDTETLPLVAQYADIIQIGARNMQNFSLLNAAGKLNKPILLKRGMSATIEELLNAAEYIANQGNYNIILCERGIRTFETATRNTLDLSAVTVIKRLSHLPVIVDPSHASGHNWAVTPLARAALAVGADGIMVEVHPNPANALSDGPQSLTFPEFQDLMKQLIPLAKLMNRKIYT